ncbi:unnamed protein product [Didymodactylos carnosus]|uniref:beta-N-acetylhexosaminidase n=1 Tax=Didymodactylos carnosus TaxID=1234261 RepID=A0A815XHI3_9BILA|nr:unnamed protein product [Didymodactylos carnosus]CAF4419203.1 unnamed protein product [Didymodactylos carnosus]
MLCISQLKKLTINITLPLTTRYTPENSHPTFCARSFITTNVMPVPYHVTILDNKMSVYDNFRIIAVSTNDSNGTDIYLERMILRFGSYIYKKTGIRINNDTENSITNGWNALYIHSNESISDYPTLGENESYELHISTKNAHLYAETLTGVSRGLATFVQLLHSDTNNDISVPSLRIVDKPRFPWRGKYLKAVFNEELFNRL